MDVFEELVATLLGHEGYWCQTRLKVELTREDKHRIGRPSSPRWELDVVGYRGKTNELIVVECKSFLDSPGVRFRNGEFGRPKLFKLFTEPATRTVVLHRLKRQLVAKGLCAKAPSIRLGLATGRIAGGTDREEFQQHFSDQGWSLYDDQWIAERVRHLAETAFENSAPHVVAKILERNR